MNFLRRLLCRHSWRPHEYIYGDEINLLGCRVIVRCQKCGAQRRVRFV